MLPADDAERTAAAARAYLEWLPPKQALEIQALPPDKQLEALISQAKQDTAHPWPDHSELTGHLNPLIEIDWEATVFQSNSSQAALPETKR